MYIIYMYTYMYIYTKNEIYNVCMYGMYILLYIFVSMY